MSLFKYVSEILLDFVIFMQNMDTEIIIATSRDADASAISASMVTDDRQMNALFLDIVSRLTA